MWRDWIGRVRLAGLVEGTSFLVLLPFAVLKRTVGGYEQEVFWIGSVHGALFVVYALVATVAAVRKELSWASWGWAAVASLVPFGPFVLDRRLKWEEHTSRPAAPREEG